MFISVIVWNWTLVFKAPASLTLQCPFPNCNKLLARLLRPNKGFNGRLLFRTSGSLPGEVFCLPDFISSNSGALYIQQSLAGNLLPFSVAQRIMVKGGHSLTDLGSSKTWNIMEMCVCGGGGVGGLCVCVSRLQQVGKHFVFRHISGLFYSDTKSLNWFRYLRNSILTPIKWGVYKTKDAEKN